MLCKCWQLHNPLVFVVITSWAIATFWYWGNFEKPQAVGTDQGVSKHSICSCQAVIRQSSSSHQAVIRQSSGSHQSVVRQSSSSHQANLSFIAQPVRMKDFSVFIFAHSFLSLQTRSWFFLDSFGPLHELKVRPKSSWAAFHAWKKLSPSFPTIY